MMGEGENNRTLMSIVRTRNVENKTELRQVVVNSGRSSSVNSRESDRNAEFLPIKSHEVIVFVGATTCCK
jgi:hypothetical protein